MPIALRIKQLSNFGRIEELTFSKNTISIGRDHANDVILLNQRRVVSRFHARIERGATGYQLVDVGSKNTTRLNGDRLECDVAYPLKHGDRFLVGDFEIEFLQRVTDPATNLAHFATASHNIPPQEDLSDLTRIYDGPHLPKK